MFRMFFIRVDTLLETYIPPNNVPVNLNGRNPAIVTTEKSTIEIRHIVFFRAGLMNISAVRINIAATASSNS